MARTFTPLLAASLLALAACPAKKPVQAVVVDPNAGKPKAPPPPTVEEARQFMADVDKGLRDAWTARDTADWARSIDITDATEAEAAKTAEAAMAYLTKQIAASKRFDPIMDQLDDETRRELLLLRIAGQTSPPDPAHAAELTKVTTEMDSTYGTGKVCGADRCQDLGELEEIMAKSRDPKALLAAWQGWHDTVGRAVKPLFEKFVPLANEGVKAAGFDDVGQLWLAGYDMPAADMVAEADRLWTQVQPLYQDLHCYVRRKLSKKYGKDVVAPTGPMPAHMLGNMWAQSWENVYDLVEPYPGLPSPDVSKELVKQGYDPVRMAKLAESFFVSLGLPQLPDTFWERSMLEQPKDREAVCHASAWDPTRSGDVRIKMCAKVDEEDLLTLHHELGHDYYFLAYHELPVLFQQGANDGFHEAIGDTIALSVTPEYLKDLGLLKAVVKNPKATIDQQMYVALQKVALLPFALLVDKWRWEAFSGKITPEQYNARWWELRQQYQGIVSAVPRTADDFDPGAKYHVASNTPYLRYFLATILQFQFQRALCHTAGFTGPLNECSIHGNKAAGDALWKMLQLGDSKPWPDALEAITGTRQMDATAMLEYFAPLEAFLAKENKGQTCGW
ncbi:MAG TPA: M2 family metallopeptidase [Kofleriaceae bacterium]|nr:M2 family metallopeptidase [Kofleriaceae bacterium]